MGAAVKVGFHLTPVMLEAAYAFLRTTPPFNRWKLPHPDDVEFRVSATRAWAGACYKYQRVKQWQIAISTFYVGLPAMLFETMAHEMVHLHQDQCGTSAKDASVHNAAFRRLAAQVCRYHGFDPKRF